MARRKRGAHEMQAWVELRAEDPEALSALAVAKATLAAGRTLASLRRLRLFELRGKLPGREEVEGLLHRSTQFYNPHKERCTVRAAADEPAPLSRDECVVVVYDRGSERRGAAERWWLHETRQKVEVREGLAWVLRFTNEPNPLERATELADLRDRRHGLLCNPHSQEFVAAAGEAPWPLWSIDRLPPAEPAREET
jgi:hypothetical protein